jgi:predicted MPP superfamily phosphohydrolase
MPRGLLSLVPLAAAATNDAAFMALGDWGATGSASMQKELNANAEGMAKFAEQYPEVKFIAAIGDNFYNYGVVSSSDNQSDANWKRSWIDVFNAHGAALAALPWYAVLGNHGYGFNPQAQVEATKAYPGKWNMPARNYLYRTKLTPNAARFVSFVFFDSTPCVTEYRSSNKSKWDPKPPSASESEWNKKHYNFSENLKAEPCQTAQLEKLLAQTEASDWKIMIVHHRVDEVNFNLTSLLAKYDVDLYLNGHLHQLEAYNETGTKTKYLTIGSGALISPHQAPGKAEEQAYLGKAAANGITYQFRAYENGFGGFFFQNNFTTLEASIYAANFTNLHSVVLSK